jgi:hypothetical protein
MPPKTHADYDRDFNLRDLFEHLRNDRDPKVKIPNASTKATAIALALAWDLQHPDKAAATYDAALAKYPRQGKRSDSNLSGGESSGGAGVD